MTKHAMDALDAKDAADLYTLRCWTAIAVELERLQKAERETLFAITQDDVREIADEMRANGDLNPTLALTDAHYDRAQTYIEDSAQWRDQAHDAITALENENQQKRATKRV